MMMITIYIYIHSIQFIYTVTESSATTTKLRKKENDRMSHRRIGSRFCCQKLNEWNIFFFLNIIITIFLLSIKFIFLYQFFQSLSLVSKTKLFIQLITKYIYGVYILVNIYTVIQYQINTICHSYINFIPISSLFILFLN